VQSTKRHAEGTAVGFKRIFFLDFPREALQYSIRSHFSFHL